MVFAKEYADILFLGHWVCFADYAAEKTNTKHVPIGFVQTAIINLKCKMQWISKPKYGLNL